eukprot:CAMPEP_0169076862 /NCGR_PEP_ID=MMETSP1015-20121227/8574_1 /TAXON_ID=342587 /ORGANISM="Karlodinium micrum, Strain CCMP2283" /LENGTH=40 /DNA_ID= /DNA_START= /DNA_END= /DNA_ORIENTATION=
MECGGAALADAADEELRMPHLPRLNIQTLVTTSCSLCDRL